MEKMTVIQYAVLSMFAWTPYVSGMSAPAHVAGMTQVEGVSPQVAESVTRWMDNPATKTGQYLNHKAGGVPVAPSNHNALRHNPEMVAKALSGNGTVDSVKLAAARMHKLQDIVHNTKPVDGWQLTSTMKNEAKELISHVERFGCFPKQLPAWLDNSGPLVAGKVMADIGKNSGAATGSLAGRPAVVSGAKQVGKSISRGVGVLAVAVPVVVCAVELHNNEKCFEKGEITEEELKISRFEVICGNATGAVAGAAGAVGGGVMGTAVALGPGTIGGAIAGSMACGIGGEYVGRKVGKMIGKAVYERTIVEKAYTRQANSKLFQHTNTKGYYIEKKD